MIKNAKTNNKASHTGAFLLITIKRDRQHYDTGKPVTDLRVKISALDENYWPWLNAARSPSKWVKPN